MDQNNNNIKSNSKDSSRPVASTKMDMKIKCKLCQKSLFREFMKKHMQVSHPNVKTSDSKKKVKCKVCKKLFSSRNLSRHLKDVHKKNKGKYFAK